MFNNFNLKTTNLSVIVPTLNEEGNIRLLVERIDNALKIAKINYEIIFIDDHSTDLTESIILKMMEHYPISFYKKEGVKGKAQSLLEGFKHAKYEIISMIDADLQYPPESIPAMYKKIIHNENDIVIANRRYIGVGLARQIPSKVFKFIFANILHGLNYDVQSGLKVFRKEISDCIDIHPSPWTFDMEFLLNAKKLSYSIGQVNIDFTERFAGTAKIKVLRASYEIGVSAIKLKFKTNPKI